MGILKIGVVGCGRIGKLHINNLINSVPVSYTHLRAHET